MDRLIRTADGKFVRKGDRVWNHYDMVAGEITEDPDSVGWFNLKQDNERNTILNGERIVAISFAEREGWLVKFPLFWERK